MSETGLARLRDEQDDRAYEICLWRKAMEIKPRQTIRETKNQENPKIL
jgi:hypothetical protein